MKKLYILLLSALYFSLTTLQMNAMGAKPIGTLQLVAEIHSADADATTGFLRITGNNIEIASPIPVHFATSTRSQTAGNYIGTFIKNVNGQPITYYVYLSGVMPRESIPTKPIRFA